MSLLGVTQPVSSQTKSTASIAGNKEPDKNCPVIPDITVVAETTDSIIQHLLAQGLSRDDIVMPGGGKDSILYLSEDFNAPAEGFENYS